MGNLRRIEVRGSGWDLENRLTYRTIVETFGEVLAETEWGSYQGDSLFLVKNEGRLGILSFGWGSCSGCDALEAASNQAEVDRLQDDLHRGIRWHDTVSDALTDLDGQWAKDSYLDNEMIAAFRDQVNKATSIVVAEGEPQHALGPGRKTATLIRDVSVQNKAKGSQGLYRLAPPLEGHEFVVVSAIESAFDTSRPETYIFPSTTAGVIADWGELPGSFQGGADHARALSGAGYEVTA